MRTSGFLTLLAAACTCGVATASSFTYNVNDVYSNFSVTGSITTDTNTGVLSMSDITGWNLTLNDGTSTLVLNPVDSGMELAGDALTASPTALYFNFDDTNYTGLIFEHPFPGSTNNYLCYNAAQGDCDGTPSSETIFIGSDAVQVDSRTGDQVIATANGVTPEPGSLALAGTGLLGMMGVIRKRIGAK